MRKLTLLLRALLCARCISRKSVLFKHKSDFFWNLPLRNKSRPKAVALLFLAASTGQELKRGCAGRFWLGVCRVPPPTHGGWAGLVGRPRHALPHTASPHPPTSVRRFTGNSSLLVADRLPPRGQCAVLRECLQSGRGSAANAAQMCPSGTSEGWPRCRGRAWVSWGETVISRPLVP